MKKNKFLAAALLMFLPLVACSNNNPSGGGSGGGDSGGGEGGDPVDPPVDPSYVVGEVEKAIIDFLAGRGVEVDKIPLLNTLTSEDLTYIDYELEPYTYEGEEYVAYFSIALEGDQTASILEVLEDLEWTVPAEAGSYGYECVDPTKKIEIDVFYDENSYSGDDYSIPPSTYLTVYAYEDIAGGDDPIDPPSEEIDLEAEILEFLATRDVELESFPYLDSIPQSAIDEAAVNPSDEDYVACYYVYFVGDYQDVILAALAEDDWSIPSTPDITFGYECVDPNELVEADVDYYEGYTSVYVYAYADLNGEDVPVIPEEGEAGTYTLTADTFGAVDAGEFTVTAYGLLINCSNGTITDDDKQIRFYANCDFSFSIEGFVITKIEFTCTASDTAKYGPGNASCDVGKYTYNGNVGTWEGESSEVNFSTSKQLRATSIVITYVEAE